MDRGPRTVALIINGERIDVVADPRRTLVDVLREDLALTGTKKACDMGNCGACTVLVDGRAMYACLMLAIDWNEHEIRTIEDLGHDGALDPIQQAFLEADAYQCGFCTPGQIMSLKALLMSNPDPTEDELRAGLSGNLCRCGAYRNILRAGRIAASRDSAAKPDHAETEPKDHAP